MKLTAGLSLVVMTLMIVMMMAGMVVMLVHDGLCSREPCIVSGLNGQIQVKQLVELTRA